MIKHENVPVEKNTREIVRQYLISKGFDPKHVNMRQHNWVIAKWNQKEFDESIHITLGKFGNMSEQIEYLMAFIWFYVTAVNDHL